MIEYFGIKNQLYEMLRNTNQDKVYHMEGDVLTHTLMVLDELYNLSEFKDISNDEQIILQNAAFYHDIGKPFTTIENNGRIISPKHGIKGEKYFRLLAYKNNYSPYLREEIAQLIRLHSVPINFYKKEEYECVALAEQVNIKLLYILSLADAKGRISDDKEEIIIQIDYFKDVCEKYDCFGKRKEFNTIEERSFFLKNGYEYKPYENKKPNVYIMCGLPGTGKSTFAESLDIPIISLDKLKIKYKVKHSDKKGIGRIVQLAKEQAKEYLRKNIDFLILQKINILLQMYKKL